MARLLGRCGHGRIEGREPDSKKNAMSTDAYGEIVSQFGYLTAKEQEELVHELSSLVALRSTSAARRSILELRGLGKEVWQGIDANDYVRKERASWDG